MAHPTAMMNQRWKVLLATITSMPRSKWAGDIELKSGPRGKRFTAAPDEAKNTAEWKSKNDFCFAEAPRADRQVRKGKQRRKSVDQPSRDGGKKKAPLSLIWRKAWTFD